MSSGSGENLGFGGGWGGNRLVWCLWVGCGLLYGVGFL